MIHNRQRLFVASFITLLVLACSSGYELASSVTGRRNLVSPRANSGVLPAAALLGSGLLS